MYLVANYKCPTSVITILNRIMSNFIWKDKMQACSWESVQAKIKRRFGIRKLQDINNVAGLKLFWRCFTTQSSWASWMKDVYCRNSSPWKIHAHPMDSGYLKVSCKGKATCLYTY